MESRRPTGLFGLEHSNHDFSDPSSFGKNIFTNAFPIALGQYMHLERQLKPIQIEAVTRNGNIYTQQTPVSWEKVINAEPENAQFEFEGNYDGYDKYTHGQANASDVVIKTLDGEHRRGLEVKLVVVPTSSSAKRDRHEQTCELVVRPPSIEQLAFSICHSFGLDRRYELLDLIRNALGKPMDYKWADRSYMARKLPLIVDATEHIIAAGETIQTPLVLMAVWRSQGQTPLLDEHAFDLFVWTDMAFLELFASAVRNRSSKSQKTITRPARSLIWLIYTLWEYAAQESLRFEGAHSKITYGSQSDKAGSFTRNSIHKFVKGQEFFYPRIKDSEVYGIVKEEFLEELSPERRLDQALVLQHLLNIKRSE